MNNQKRSKLLIIEPSPVIRQGLKVLLTESAEFTVCGMYADLQDFHKNHANITPDIILINPAVVSFHKEFFIKTVLPDYTQAVFIAIHYGYVDSETLAKFDGVLNIYNDSSTILKKLHTVIKTTPDRSISASGDNTELSEREKEILIAVAKGLTNKEIADKHFISIHTVISHRKNITRKTGIKTISGLTIYAIFNNFISQEDLV